MVTQDWRVEAQKGLKLAREHRAPTAALLGLAAGLVGIFFASILAHLVAWAFFGLAGYLAHDSINAFTTRRQRERDEELEMARRLVQLARQREDAGQKHEAKKEA